MTWDFLHFLSNIIISLNWMWTWICVHNSWERFSSHLQEFTCKLAVSSHIPGHCFPAHPCHWSWAPLSAVNSIWESKFLLYSVHSAQSCLRSSDPTKSQGPEKARKVARASVWISFLIPFPLRFEVPRFSLSCLKTLQVKPLKINNTASLCFLVLWTRWVFPGCRFPG